MQKLATVGDGATQLSKLRSAGHWPLLIELRCHDAANARMYVSNTSDLVYRAEDVTVAEIDDDDLAWGCEGEGGVGCVPSKFSR